MTIMTTRGEMDVNALRTVERTLTDGSVRVEYFCGGELVRADAITGLKGIETAASAYDFTRHNDAKEQRS